MTLVDVHYAERDRVVIATLDGEIDMSNDDSLRLDIERRVTNEPLGLVLDLTGVDYMDSSGIQLLYQLADRLSTRGQKLAIVIPDGSPVADTLRYADALDAMNAARTVDQAVASLAV